MIELKRCPFCGGDAYTGIKNYKEGNSWIDLFHVACTECGSKTGSFENKFSAVEAWNRRVKDGNV